jgi:hypothetical protein
MAIIKAPKQIPGYVRCGVTHIECEWKFEVMDEKERVAIVDIETADGPISIGLNRPAAEKLLQTLIGRRINQRHEGARVSSFGHLEQ